MNIFLNKCVQGYILQLNLPIKKGNSPFHNPLLLQNTEMEYKGSILKSFGSLDYTYSLSDKQATSISIS